MVQESEHDSSIDPEFLAAVTRARERYNTNVAEDRRARLENALAELDAAFGNYNAIHEKLCLAADTTPEAAERLIEDALVGLGDAAFLRWRLADQPRPSVPSELRAAADAVEWKMWKALFEAVKIDKTVLSHPVIVDHIRRYQDVGDAKFFAELGAAVAKPGGLHRSRDIDVAILGFAGREVGYTYEKISNLVERILGRPVDAESIKRALQRHAKTFPGLKA